MDNCHARDQRTADIAGHGKTILTGRMSKKRRNISDWRRSSSERKSGTLCGSFSRNLRIHLWNAVQKEYLSSGQIERILTDANDRLCSNCYHREICWGKSGRNNVSGGEALVRALEKR